MDKKKVILYGAAGAGTLLFSYALYKLLRKSKSTELKGNPELTPLVNQTVGAEFGGISNDAVIPALAIIHDRSTGEYSQFSLNYTPRASAEDESVISDIDFARLQGVGLIPDDFPIDQVVAVPSHNGHNWFFVGYSAPYTIETNRDDLTVIEPVWAVSYGVNFDASNSLPEGMEDDTQFYEVALRTLFAEWMLTNRGVDGCHRNQTLSACNVERSAILNIILQRTHMKQARIDGKLDFTSVIYGPGNRWNKGRTFMDAYEGAIPPDAQERFNSFYYTSFWPMPQFSGHAIGFIHPLSMSKTRATNPLWVKRTEPLDDVFGPYLANHVVELGSAVFSDIRKTFK